jgi:hypothetical protein
MNHVATIHGLEKAIKLEKSMVEAYRNAGKHPAHVHQQDTARDHLFVLEESHQEYANRLTGRLHALHKMDGDGMIGEALHGLRDALSNVVAGLPVDFLHSTTTTTVEMLRRAEQELITHYESILVATGDQETHALVDAAISNGRHNLDELSRIEAL